MKIETYISKKTGESVSAFQITIQDILDESRFKEINEWLGKYHAMIRTVTYQDFQTAEVRYDVTVCWVECVRTGRTAQYVVADHYYIYVDKTDKVWVEPAATFEAAYSKPLKVEKRAITCAFEAIQIIPEQLTLYDCNAIDAWLCKDDFSTSNRIVRQETDGGSISDNWFLHTTRHSDIRAHSGDYIVKLYAGNNNECSNFVVMSPEDFKNLDKCLRNLFKKYGCGGYLLQ
jgi:hypothetical protein